PFKEKTALFKSSATALLCSNIPHSVQRSFILALAQWPALKTTSLALTTHPRCAAVLKMPSMSACSLPESVSNTVMSNVVAALSLTVALLQPSVNLTGLVTGQPTLIAWNKCVPALWALGMSQLVAIAIITISLD
ncbi:meiosis protein MEI2, partial [Trichophyton tonsurans CBS 112818]